MSAEEDTSLGVVGLEWSSYPKSHQVPSIYYDGDMFADFTDQHNFFPAYHALLSIKNKLSQSDRDQLEQIFRSLARTRSLCKRLITDVANKRAQAIKAAKKNPNTIMAGKFKDPDTGEWVNRWEDLLDVAWDYGNKVLLINMPAKYEVDTKNLYAGLNKCHSGHNGITVAKLIHAVVCFKDITLGTENWQWEEETQDEIEQSRVVDTSQAQISLLPKKGNARTSSMKQRGFVGPGAFVGQEKIFGNETGEIPDLLPPISQKRKLYHETPQKEQALTQSLKLGGAQDEAGTGLGVSVVPKRTDSLRAHPIRPLQDLSNFPVAKKQKVASTDIDLIQPQSYNLFNNLDQYDDAAYKAELNQFNDNMYKQELGYYNQPYIKSQKFNPVYDDHLYPRGQSPNLDEDPDPREEEPICEQICDYSRCCELKWNLRMQVIISIIVMVITLILIIVLSSCAGGGSARDKANQMSGRVTDRMVRKVVKPRPSFEYDMEAYNLTWYDEPALDWGFCASDAYWNEEGMIEITPDAEKQMLEATQNMHFMCLEAVDTVVKDDKLLRLFHIPSDLWPAVRKSWGMTATIKDGKPFYTDDDFKKDGYQLKKKQLDFLGRFDWSWDGVTEPKLLEYNADTPSLLIESAQLQLKWARDKFLMDNPDKLLSIQKNPELEWDDYYNDRDQYLNLVSRDLTQSNYLDTMIQRVLTYISKECKKVGFLTVDYDDESAAQMGFLYDLFLKRFWDHMDTAMENISDLKLDYRSKTGPNTYYSNWPKDKQCEPKWFLNNQEMDCLINQYPKEWLVNEIERDELLKYDLAHVRSFEPWWKLILGNKALLPLLWSMFPQHPNLLPAFYSDPIKDGKFIDHSQNSLKAKELVYGSRWVSKPLYGREGLGVIVREQKEQSNSTKEYYYETTISRSYQLRQKQEDYQEWIKSTQGTFLDEKMKLGNSIYQLYHDLPKAQGRVIQTSTWVVGGVAAGINFREGLEDTNFGDISPFLPHIVNTRVDRKESSYRKREKMKVLEFKISAKAKWLWDSIYGGTITLTKDIFAFGGKHTFKDVLLRVIPDDKLLYSQIVDGDGRYYLNGKPYKEWAAYKNLNSDQLTFNSKMDTLGDLEFQVDTLYDLRWIKCNADDFDPSSKGKNVVLTKILSKDRDINNYINKNPSFSKKKRKNDFGRLVFDSIDYKGEQHGKWYSVDNQGKIRQHSYTNSAQFRDSRQKSNPHRAARRGRTSSGTAS